MEAKNQTGDAGRASFGKRFLWEARLGGIQTSHEGPGDLQGVMEAIENS